MQNADLDRVVLCSCPAGKGNHGSERGRAQQAACRSHIVAHWRLPLSQIVHRTIESKRHARREKGGLYRYISGLLEPWPSVRSPLHAERPPSAHICLFVRRFTYSLIFSHFCRPPAPVPAAYLLTEQVRMGAGSLEMNTAGLQLVDEEPIRLDVKIAIADPVGFQWVVAKPGRQRSVIDKQRQNVAYPSHASRPVSRPA